MNHYDSMLLDSPVCPECIGRRPSDGASRRHLDGSPYCDLCLDKGVVSNKTRMEWEHQEADREDRFFRSIKP